MTSNKSNIINVDFKRPSNEPVHLIDNVDVAFALWACNMFGVQYVDIEELEYNVLSVEDLYTFKPEFIRECLKQALQSQLLSKEGKKIVTRLLTNNRGSDDDPVS